MDFDLSDDQMALQEGARELLDGLAAPAQVRAHTASGAAFDAALWAAMADQGWLGIEVAEARGGVGLGPVEVAGLCEELGRHAAPAPHAGSGTPTRVSGCSAGARRSPPPTSSAARRGPWNSRSSTPRTASSSAARSARSRP